MLWVGQEADQRIGTQFVLDGIIYSPENMGLQLSCPPGYTPRLGCSGDSLAQESVRTVGA